MSIDFVKCSNCSSPTPVNIVEKYGNGLCKNCYYHSEIYECSSCGREITKFEVDNNNGECYECNPEF